MSPYEMRGECPGLTDQHTRIGMPRNCLLYVRNKLGLSPVVTTGKSAIGPAVCRVRWGGGPVAILVIDFGGSTE